ncbi:hypothetical protein BDB13_3812 [Rhodococcus sp. OK302]|nr:hypothetical protein BDB13_3812 [Rhodococcus sp. OK302]
MPQREHRIFQLQQRLLLGSIVVGTLLGASAIASL